MVYLHQKADYRGHLNCMKVVIGDNVVGIDGDERTWEAEADCCKVGSKRHFFYIVQANGSDSAFLQ